MRPVSRERTALSLTPLATKHDTTTHSVPTSGTTERTGIVNVRKPVGWDKDSLIGKAKTTHPRKVKQGIYSSLPFGRQVLMHSQESRVPSHSGLRRQMPSLWMFPPSFFFPSSICRRRCHMIWNVPLVSWDQLSWMGLLPALCASPAPSLVGWGESQKRSWLYVGSAQQ